MTKKECIAVARLAALCMPPDEYVHAALVCCQSVDSAWPCTGLICRP